MLWLFGITVHLWVQQESQKFLITIHYFLSISPWAHKKRKKKRGLPLRSASQWGPLWTPEYNINFAWTHKILGFQEVCCRKSMVFVSNALILFRTLSPKSVLNSSVQRKLTWVTFLKLKNILLPCFIVDMSIVVLSY